MEKIKWDPSFGVNILDVDENLKKIIEASIEIGIPYLTVYAFSTENWHRPKKEIDFLMNLYRHVLDRKVDSFHRKKIKINC